MPTGQEVMKAQTLAGSFAGRGFFYSYPDNHMCEGVKILPCVGLNWLGVIPQRKLLQGHTARTKPTCNTDPVNLTYI